MTSSTGHLVTTVTSSSSSWTTYFTTESSPVTLAGAGDELKITWVFTPSGVATSGTSQDFRLAVVDSPVRLATDQRWQPGQQHVRGLCDVHEHGDDTGQQQLIPIDGPKRAWNQLRLSVFQWQLDRRGQWRREKRNRLRQRHATTPS